MQPVEKVESGDSHGSARRIVPRSRGQRLSFSSSFLQSASMPPADLQDEAAARVGLIATVVIGVSLLEAVIGHLWPYFSRSDYPTKQEKLDLIGNLLVIAVSSLVLVVGRLKRVSTLGRLRFGLGYLLTIAFLVSLTDHADHYWAGGHRQHGIPWVAGLILVFPVIIPIRPLRALILGLLMAASSPIAMWMHVFLLGYSRPDLAAMLDAFPFMFALVASYLAKVQQHLGSEVGRARRLGAYTLERRIGSGGMGEVWAARHRFLARPAAIKLIQAEVKGVDQRVLPERFEREAKATAALKSPHTVQVYDFGLSDDGRLYYAMELLEGTDLNTLVKQHGAQPAERVVHWLRQICHSLAEAHESGLVHRDVKPANLFVCRHGRDDDFIKVLDFGLVSLKSSPRDPNPNLTATGHVIGTPCCMPPEMATDSHPVDARSDIYSLGCVAYFLLTGNHVFCAESAIEVVVGHVTQVPTPPSQATNRAIPAELEKLVLACLAKTPQERPQSADAVLACLDRCQLERDWTQTRAREWWDGVAVA
jgi:eukaryotic-like serine/threonine-protein kinase